MWPIMKMTWLELMRRRFIPAAIVAVVVLVGLTSWGFWHLARDTHLSTLEVRGVMSVLAILMAYLFSFVLAAAAIALAAPTIASDVENGTLLPILARPLSRGTIVLAKTIALALIMAAFAALSVLLEFTAIRFVSGYWPPQPFTAASYLGVFAVVMVVLGTLLSTRMSAIASSIAGIAAFGVAWMGGIAGSIGQALDNTALLHAGTVTALLLPTDAMWRSAVFHLEPAALLVGMQANEHNWPGPFLVTAPEPGSIVVWTVGWLLVVVTVAVRGFARRDI